MLDKSAGPESAHGYPVATPQLRRVIDRNWSWRDTCAPVPSLLPLIPSPGGMEIFFYCDGGFAHTSDAPRDCRTHIRDRALMVLPFARIGAALAMRVDRLHAAMAAMDPFARER